MPRAGKFRSRIFNSSSPAATAIAAFLFTLVLTFAAIQPAHAQSYAVLYNFPGGNEGAHPWAGVLSDALGNLYGTTSGFPTEGNPSCLSSPYVAGACGTVFKLTRAGSDWTFSTLYSFVGGTDGARPGAPLTLGSDGSLYGTTSMGGTECRGNGCGTVFKLTPSNGVWTENVIYRFTGGADGGLPGGGALLLDQSGNLYGTTSTGGSLNAGTAFELTPTGDHWTETVIHNFGAEGDGAEPWAGVVMDPAGNLYGTTLGGAPGGTIYEVTPVNGGWREQVLYSITGEFAPTGLYSGLTFDSAGNLYGATEGSQTSGGVFLLSPANGSWNFQWIYGFNNGVKGPGNSFAIGFSPLTLYGTAGDESDAYIIKFSPYPRDQPYEEYHLWNPTNLHNFEHGQSGTGVFLASDGNLYGTTTYGGSYGYGVVYQLTP